MYDAHKIFIREWIYSLFWVIFFNTQNPTKMAPKKLEKRESFEKKPNKQSRDGLNTE